MNNRARRLSGGTLWIGVVVFALAGTSARVQAQWLWDWAYRVPVDVSNPCGNEVTNYAVRVDLDGAFAFGHAESDGADLRVTTDDGETPVPFWIETWNGVSETASVWINVPTLPLAGTTVYFYYGNPGASPAADADAVFTTYDGFEDYGTGEPPAPTDWARYAGNPILAEGSSGSWDDHGSTFCTVVEDDAGGYLMFYHGFAFSGPHQIGLATAANPEGPWTKHPTPVVTPGPAAWDAAHVRVPWVWKEGPGDYRMVYTGANAANDYQIGYATSPDGYAWTKHPSNPVFNDPNAWAHNDCENWGLIKVGTEYHLWYCTRGIRESSLAISTDLVNWTPYSPTPVLATQGGDRTNQYCVDIFKYDGQYYLLVPSQDSSYNYAKLYLYRCANPYFEEADRELVRVVHHVGPNGAWDDHDTDTPYVFTLDVERTVFYNDELWCFYAGEGGANLWKVGLHIEPDIGAALSSAEGASWTTTGDVTVVDTPVRQGQRSLCQNGGGTTCRTEFTAQETGVVGTWLRRTGTSAGDLDIYVYGDGGATLSCVAGLGRDGDFHYWNGSFQPTGVNWATNTWYLVTVVFDATVDQYDFVVRDESNSELVRVEGIAFGNPSASLDAMMHYTSVAFSDSGYADDFHVRPWCGGDPTALVGPEETPPPTDLVVDVSLEGVVASPLTRCITFRLWTCARMIDPPDAQLREELTFIDGTASAVISIPPAAEGEYTCVTVDDDLHSLRRTLAAPDFQLVGSQYVADFVAAGKGLVGGDLNNDPWIDSLDFGVFVDQYAAVVGASDCDTTAPHADVTGDGIVGTGDFTFIAINYLQSDETNCCDGAVLALGPDVSRPVIAISRQELVKRGLGHLVVADLNRDGWLDIADIAAFAAGARPAPSTAPTRRFGGKTGNASRP